MGLFGRKKTDNRQPQSDPVSLYAWELPSDGGSLNLTTTHQEVIEEILTDSGAPNKNQTVRASLRPVGAASIEVYWGERLAGVAEGDEAARYVKDLNFLTASGRYAVVQLHVPSRKSKHFGTLSVAMPYGDHVAVPFNQPPPDVPERTFHLSPSIKNTHLHVGDLRRLAPTHGTPGWFILTPTADGGVDLYAPEYGRQGLGTKVGAVYKDEVPDTRERLAGEPCAVLGRVLWYDNGPQIRLRY